MSFDEPLTHCRIATEIANAYEHAIASEPVDRWVAIWHCDGDENFLVPETNADVYHGSLFFKSVTGKDASVSKHRLDTSCVFIRIESGADDKGKVIFTVYDTDLRTMARMAKMDGGHTIEWWMENDG